jgi:NAD(P)-dependent dehydrogenase (short-subunit alcohol dehydrogenase family)
MVSTTGFDLEGRVVLITGAAERAGRSFARSFAAAGARVVVNHLPHQEDLARAVVAEIASRGGEAISVPADITCVDEARALVDMTVDRFDRLDVVVHNASTFTPVPWTNVDEAHFDAAFAVNVKGPFFLSQAAARVMQAQGEGRIIALVGHSLVEAWPDFIPHAVAKTALARLMEQLAVALAPTIACNSVAPAQFLGSDDGENDALRTVRGEALPHDGLYEHAAGVWLREVDADAVTEVLIYLSTCSPQISGTTMRVDGGKALV